MLRVPPHNRGKQGCGQPGTIDTESTPDRVIVLPFVLKGKVVCTLYADGGESDDLSPRMIGQLYQLGRAVSGTFEQLIMKAKKKR